MSRTDAVQLFQQWCRKRCQQRRTPQQLWQDELASPGQRRLCGARADILNSTTEHEQGAIVVIASAQTFGDLRKHYAAGVAHRLQAEIAKDFVGHATDDNIDVILVHVS